MRRTALLTAAISIVLAFALAIFTAGKLVDHVERHTERQLVTVLNEAGESWASIRADGFRVVVGGLAVDEAAKFRTLQLISGNVNSNRIDDKTLVSQPDGLLPPRFSLEILRNVEQVSLIGLIPTSTGREYILERVQELNSETQITDMLEQADHPAPDGWKDSVDFALSRLKQVPRSKVSVTPERVKVTAVSDTPEEQQSLKKSLENKKPDNLTLILDISAPRPVISPFQFRLKVKNNKGELEACSADNNKSRAKIVRALHRVSLTGDVPCEIGLGVPTTDWADAVILAIDTMSELKAGTITFTDSDVSLIADADVDQPTFDTAVAKLENALPKLFSLQAVLTPKPLIDGQTGEVIVPDFTATKSPEGMVQLRGRLPDELRKNTLYTYASSLFGKGNVHNQTRIVDGLPDGWTVRSMAGLEALAHLHHGSVVILPDEIIIKGKSTKEDIKSIVSRIFSTRIDSNANYKTNVAYDENLVVKDDHIGLSPSDCKKQIKAVLQARQIDFAPASASIEEASLGVIDSIAEILKECPEAKFEISGHTDSQGSEGTNLTLSQGRADSVLQALLDRRVLTAKMISKGYGEAQPIADNATEQGRAQNRRIEFRLIEESIKDGQN